MPNEIELKLELTASGIDALLASELLGADYRETALHAVYFDTPGHDLHRHGHSLRIRDDDGIAMQTVKTGDVAAGLFSRGEWELPAAGRQPVADDRTPVSDLLARRRDELVPVFEVPARRRSYRLHVHGASIELAIDRAEAVAGNRSSRFCEVELELLAGPGAALFALAREIDAVAPVRISVLTKAERGYQLLGALPDSIRAEGFSLDPAMDVPSAFAAIASACLRQYRLNEAILLDRQIPEAVHQARIGLRRLRVAITLFKAMLPGPERDRLTARLRDLAACLGEARDLDVLTARAESGPLLERLSHARDAAHAALNRKLKAKATRLLPLDLCEWIAAGDWRHDPATQALREMPLRDFAATALDRLRRRIARDGRHLAAIDSEARHLVRKDAKKLRYAVEFLAPPFGAQRRRKRFVTALQALQDDLGTLNDLATAEARLAALGMTGTVEAARFLSGWKTGDLLESAARARHALLDAKPFWR